MGVRLAPSLKRRVEPSRVFGYDATQPKPCSPEIRRAWPAPKRSCDRSRASHCNPIREKVEGALRLWTWLMASCVARQNFLACCGSAVLDKGGTLRAKSCKRQSAQLTHASGAASHPRELTEVATVTAAATGPCYGRVICAGAVRLASGRCSDRPSDLSGDRRIGTY